ncbi:MAG: hypothetical protein J0G95_10805 [Rhizobiales bacterium]|nr:hypothetical protein [Hyphomicrobiales bacterium]
MTDPLAKHDLNRLEAAAEELNAHIKKRRGVYRPSLLRRIIGLCFSIPIVSFGLFVAIHTMTVSPDHFFKFMIFGGALIIGGMMWIYSDWFE